MKIRKKLIEVALPLDDINVASAREKSIRHGHPSTLHLWWARRPLAAARAVIFSQMVDDPSEYVELLLSDSKTKRKAESVLKARRKVWKEAKETYERASSGGVESQVPAPGPEPTLEGIIAEVERERLFEIIRQLVRWENTTNEDVLQEARDEIWQSWRRACADNADHPRAKELFDRHKLPAFHDPFAGGGSLPLEAQRLGLESYASDLNPVAVLINKAMIEIPPKFAGRPPVNPVSRKKLDSAHGWSGAQGLAEDVRYYGQWMRDEAEKRIGHLYPKMKITPEMVKNRPDLKKYLGKELTVIAWLWARTVKSPNPAFADVEVPLVSTFMLSTKKGKEAYVEPVVDNGDYCFNVKNGKPKGAAASKSGTKLSRGANFECLMSGTPIGADYIRTEARAGRMRARMMAIVAEGDRERVYLPAKLEDEAVAHDAVPEWKPDVEFMQQALGFRVGNYGMTKWSDLFTPRQLVALTTFSDLVQEARKKVKQDAVAAGLDDDGKPLRDAGIGASAYADAIGVYLGIGVSKIADYNSSLVQWSKARDQAVHVFGRQALPMVWDYAEVSPLAGAAGDLTVSLDGIARSVEGHVSTVGSGHALNLDAQTQGVSFGKVISTDPPYYDNIGYADLSDYFYVWLRRSLQSIFPETFATVAVPKAEELVATPFRHGGKEKAEVFFLNGMTQTMHRLAQQAHPAFPVTVYYAFKQAESSDSTGTASTGWETFLDAVIRAGFVIGGTWPVRTEKPGRMRENDSNALASSIILVCLHRDEDATSATRRDLVNSLKNEMPAALIDLQRGKIAPVDLAQAAIGPGMAVFTRYSEVLDVEGKPLSVREALALINQILDESLAEQEGDFDTDSRWAVTWFDERGFDEGDYGRAEQLSKSKNTSVEGMVQAGIVESKRGKVRLLRPEELPDDWDPASDPRLTAWEIVHHLIRTLEAGGEGAASLLVAKLEAKAEIASELAYRLYNICDRKKRADEARSYNGLIQSWTEINRLAVEQANRPPQQLSFIAGGE